MNQDGDTEKLSSLSKGLYFYDLLLPNEWQSSKVLGERVGVDGRTIKGYASLLIAYGWPIDSQNGRGRGYKLGEGPDGLRFTTRELFSLAILLAHGSSTLPAAEAEKLKAKLKALLPAQARAQVTDLEDLITVQGFAPNDWDLVERVGTCLYNRCYSLVLEYQGRGDNETLRRHVLPQRIRPQNGTWYLDLFDLDKHGHRSFRFDRIQRATLLKQERQHQEPPERTFENHKWDFGAGEPQEMCLEVSPGLARWLEENPEHPSQKSSSQDGRHFVTYHVRRLELFADWTMSLRGARVLEPASLRSLIQERARAWLDDDGTMSIDWET